MNSNYECPYCHTKFYDLSFVDTKYDYVYNFRNEFYARHLQTSSFNVKAEMEALATSGENGEPILFVVEAVPKKKK